LLGCSGLGIEGDWTLKEKIGGKESTMELTADGEGEATINVYVNQKLTKLKYDVAWEENDKGTKYELEMECRGSNCTGANFDFTMDCKEKKEGERLSCDGDNAFADFDFVWDREDA